MVKGASTVIVHLSALLRMRYVPKDYVSISYGLRTEMLHRLARIGTSLLLCVRSSTTKGPLRIVRSKRWTLPEPSPRYSLALSPEVSRQDLKDYSGKWNGCPLQVFNCLVLEHIQQCRGDLLPAPNERVLIHAIQGTLHHQVWKVDMLIFFVIRILAPANNA